MAHKVDERGLRGRLDRIEALHRRAATPGERAAAARARERIAGRLAELRAQDPVVAFVEEHLAQLGVPAAPPPPPARLPHADDLLRVLAHWERGAWTAREVAAWAADQVDAVELPADPSAEGAIVAEVLLQLSQAARPPIALVPAARAFVRTGDWAEWFAVVAQVVRR